MIIPPPPTEPVGLEREGPGAKGRPAHFIGASRPPTGSPMGFPTFFFCCCCLFLVFLFVFVLFFNLFYFFLPLHIRCQFVVKTKSDWAEILQNHADGHPSQHPSGQG